MIILTRKKITINFVVGFFILICFAGCTISKQYLSDEPIDKKEAERIRPGETSVREALTLLGPPIAIARHGHNMVFPPRATNAALFLDADSFLELFSSNRVLREEEVVYYYKASREKLSAFFVFFLVINGGGYTEQTEVQQLWLLVNEKTGIIEDYRYQDAGQPVAGSASPIELR